MRTKPRKVEFDGTATAVMTPQLIKGQLGQVVPVRIVSQVAHVLQLC